MTSEVLLHYLLSASFYSVEQGILVCCFASCHSGSKINQIFFILCLLVTIRVSCTTFHTHIVGGNYIAESPLFDFLRGCVKLLSIYNALT